MLGLVHAMWSLCTSLYTSKNSAAIKTVTEEQNTATDCVCHVWRKHVLYVQQ